ncbi:MAG: hypothetical protein WBE76_21415 [Terracidiphilus sp.]
MATTYRSAFVVYRELLRAFPNLRNNRDWCLRSPLNDSYQCVAWAVCRADRKWWPLNSLYYYWLPGLPRVTPVFGATLFTPVDYITRGLARLGFESCGHSSDFEFGYQKVAVYATYVAGATHVARQSMWGRSWLSKLGELEDIRHKSLTAVGGDTAYGDVVQILKRSWITAARNNFCFRYLMTYARISAQYMKWMVLELKRKTSF